MAGMYDNELVREILLQLQQSIRTIEQRFAVVKNPDYFTNSPAGMEKLDAICMQLIAMGESLKNLDKITEGTLLSNYSEIDWRGAKGMRDIICHHYFDVDAEAIYDVCANKLKPLSSVIEKILQDM
jgi:uncharacterized protein with HEPN domain